MFSLLDDKEVEKNKGEPLSQDNIVLQISIKIALNYSLFKIFCIYSSLR